MSWRREDQDYPYDRNRHRDYDRGSRHGGRGHYPDAHRQDTRTPYYPDRRYPQGDSRDFYESRRNASGRDHRVPGRDGINHRENRLPPQRQGTSYDYEITRPRYYDDDRKPELRSSSQSDYRWHRADLNYNSGHERSNRFSRDNRGDIHQSSPVDRQSSRLSPGNARDFSEGTKRRLYTESQTSARPGKISFDYGHRPAHTPEQLEQTEELKFEHGGQRLSTKTSDQSVKEGVNNPDHHYNEDVIVILDDESDTGFRATTVDIHSNCGENEHTISSNIAVGLPVPENAVQSNTFDEDLRTDSTVMFDTDYRQTSQQTIELSPISKSSVVPQPHSVETLQNDFQDEDLRIQLSRTSGNSNNSSLNNSFSPQKPIQTNFEATISGENLASKKLQNILDISKTIMQLETKFKRKKTISGSDTENKDNTASSSITSASTPASDTNSEVNLGRHVQTSADNKSISETEHVAGTSGSYVMKTGTGNLSSVPGMSSPEQDVRIPGIMSPERDARIPGIMSPTADDNIPGFESPKSNEVSDFWTNRHKVDEVNCNADQDCRVMQSETEHQKQECQKQSTANLLDEQNESQRSDFNLHDTYGRQRHNSSTHRHPGDKYNKRFGRERRNSHEQRHYSNNDVKFRNTEKRYGRNEENDQHRYRNTNYGKPHHFDRQRKQSDNSQRHRHPDVNQEHTKQETETNVWQRNPGRGFREDENVPKAMEQDMKGGPIGGGDYKKTKDNNSKVKEYVKEESGSFTRLSREHFDSLTKGSLKDFKIPKIRKNKSELSIPVKGLTNTSESSKTVKDVSKPTDNNNGSHRSNNSNMPTPRGKYKDTSDTSKSFPERHSSVFEKFNFADSKVKHDNIHHDNGSINKVKSPSNDKLTSFDSNTSGGIFEKFDVVTADSKLKPGNTHNDNGPITEPDNKLKVSNENLTSFDGNSSGGIFDRMQLLLNKDKRKANRDSTQNSSDRSTSSTACKKENRKEKNEETQSSKGYCSFCAASAKSMMKTIDTVKHLRCVNGQIRWKNMEVMLPEIVVRKMTTEDIENSKLQTEEKDSKQVLSKKTLQKGLEKLKSQYKRIVIVTKSESSENSSPIKLKSNRIVSDSENELSQEIAKKKVARLVSDSDTDNSPLKYTQSSSVSHSIPVIPEKYSQSSSVSHSIPVIPEKYSQSSSGTHSIPVIPEKYSQSSSVSHSISMIPEKYSQSSSGTHSIPVIPEKYSQSSSVSHSIPVIPEKYSQSSSGTHSIPIIPESDPPCISPGNVLSDDELEDGVHMLIGSNSDDDGFFMEIGSDEETQTLTLDPADIELKVKQEPGDSEVKQELDDSNRSATVLISLDKNSEVVDKTNKVAEIENVKICNTTSATQTGTQSECKSVHTEKKVPKREGKTSGVGGRLSDEITTSGGLSSIGSSGGYTDSVQQNTDRKVCTVSITIADDDGDDDDEEEMSQSILGIDLQSSGMVIVERDDTCNDTTGCDERESESEKCHTAENDCVKVAEESSNGMCGKSTDNESNRAKQVEEKVSSSDDDLPVIKRPKKIPRSRIFSQKSKSEESKDSDSNNVNDPSETSNNNGKITPMKKKLFKPSRKGSSTAREEESGVEGDVEDNLNIYEEPTQIFRSNEAHPINKHSQDDDGNNPTQPYEFSQSQNKTKNSIQADDGKIDPPGKSDNIDESNETSVAVKEEPNWLKNGYTQEPDTIFISDDDDFMVMTIQQPVIDVDSSDNEETKTVTKPSIKTEVKEEFEHSEIHDPDFMNDDDYDSDNGIDFEPEDFFEMVSRLSEPKQTHSDEENEDNYSDNDPYMFGDIDEPLQDSNTQHTDEAAGSQSDVCSAETQPYMDEPLPSSQTQVVDNVDLYMQDTQIDSDSGENDLGQQISALDYHSEFFSHDSDSPSKTGMEDLLEKVDQLPPENTIIIEDMGEDDEVADSLTDESDSDASAESISMLETQNFRMSDDESGEATTYDNAQTQPFDENAGYMDNTQVDEEPSTSNDNGDMYGCGTQICDVTVESKNSDYLKATQVDTDYPPSSGSKMAKGNASKISTHYNFETQPLDLDKDKHAICYETLTQIDQPSTENDNVENKTKASDILDFIETETSDLDDFLNESYSAETQVDKDAVGNRKNEREHYDGETQLFDTGVNQKGDYAAETQVDNTVYVDDVDMYSAETQIATESDSTIIDDYAAQTQENMQEDQITDPQYDMYLQKSTGLPLSNVHKRLGINLYHSFEEDVKLKYPDDDMFVSGKLDLFMAHTQVDPQNMSEEDDIPDPYLVQTQIDKEDHFSDIGDYDFLTQLDEAIAESTSSSAKPGGSDKGTKNDKLKGKRPFSGVTDSSSGEELTSSSVQQKQVEESPAKKLKLDNQQKKPEKEHTKPFTLSNKQSTDESNQMKKMDGVQGKQAILIQPMPTKSIHASTPIYPPPRSKGFMSAKPSIKCSNATKDDMWLSKKPSKDKGKGKPEKRKRNKSSDSSFEITARINEARCRLQERNMMAIANPGSVADPHKKLKHPTSCPSTDTTEDVDLPSLSQAIDKGYPILDASVLIQSKKHPALRTEVDTSAATIVTSTVSMSTSTTTVSTTSSSNAHGTIPVVYVATSCPKKTKYDPDKTEKDMDRDRDPGEHKSGKDSSKVKRSSSERDELGSKSHHRNKHRNSKDLRDPDKKSSSKSNSSEKSDKQSMSHRKGDKKDEGKSKEKGDKDAGKSESIKKRHSSGMDKISSERTDKDKYHDSNKSEEVRSKDIHHSNKSEKMKSKDGSEKSHYKKDNDRSEKSHRNDKQTSDKHTSDKNDNHVSGKHTSNKSDKHTSNKSDKHASNKSDKHSSNKSDKHASDKHKQTSDKSDKHSSDKSDKHTSNKSDKHASVKHKQTSDKSVKYTSDKSDKHTSIKTDKHSLEKHNKKTSDKSDKQTSDKSHITEKSKKMKDRHVHERKEKDSKSHTSSKDKVKTNEKGPHLLKESSPLLSKETSRGESETKHQGAVLKQHETLKSTLQPAQTNSATGHSTIQTWDNSEREEKKTREDKQSVSSSSSNKDSSSISKGPGNEQKNTAKKIPVSFKSHETRDQGQVKGKIPFRELLNRNNVNALGTSSSGKNLMAKTVQASSCTSTAVNTGLSNKGGVGCEDGAKKKRTVTWSSDMVQIKLMSPPNRRLVPSTSAENLMKKIPTCSIFPQTQCENLPPDLMKMTNLLKWDNVKAIILKWHPSWFEERDKMEQVGSKKCDPPPVTEGLGINTKDLFPLCGRYTRLEQYINRFMLPLLLHETWQSLYTDWREKKIRNQLYKLKFTYTHTRNCDKQDLKLQEYILTGLMTGEERKQLSNLHELDLVALKMYGQDNIQGVVKTGVRDFLGLVVRVSSKSLAFTGEGKRRNPDSVEVTVIVKVRKRNFDPSKTHLTEIQPLSSIVCFHRQINALASFQSSPLCPDLLYPTLNSVYCERAVASLPHDRRRLNESQSVAVNTVFKMVSHHSPRIPRVCLLQGPPGTGKSFTIVNIIQRIVKEKKGQCRICLTAPSHAAVDNLLRNIQRLNSETGNTEGKVKVVRLGKKNSIHTDVQGFSLDNLVQKHLEEILREKVKHIPQNLQDYIANLKSDISEAQKKIQNSKDNLQTLKLRNDLNRMKKEKENLESKFQVDRKIFPGMEEKAKTEILTGAHVIAGTLSSMGSALLTSKGIKFDCVIVDEATQATEIDTLIPLQRGTTKLILVGDPEQLSPTVLSQVAGENNFSLSLFERLHKHFSSSASKASPVIFLDTQYRMDKEIASFPCNYIYNKRLKTATGDNKGNLKPYLLYDIREGEEQFSQGSRSMSNQMEAMFTAELCKFIRQETKFTERSIGIIAPYSKQKDEVLKMLADRGLRNIEVSTVDGFQGREKYIVIMTCVRAVSGSLGFVGNRNRMNVALTRAKYAMYLVGHFGALESSDEWKVLIDDAKQRRKMVTVSIDSYKQSLRSCLKSK